MTNKFGKVLSLVLALVLVLAMIPAPHAHAATTQKIYFENTGNWSTVNAYYWQNGGEITWPGKAMTKVEGNTYSIDVPTNMTKIIFNNGSTQTGDLTIPTDGKNMFNYGSNSWGTYNNSCTHSWAAATCTAPKTCTLCGEVKKENVVTAKGHSYDANNVCTVCGASEQAIFFTNAGNWSTVNIYYWSDANNTMTTWPGDAMTKVDGNIYKYVVPAGTQYVIFNNGSTQTDDLTIPAGKNMYTYNGDWSNYSVCNHVWGDGVVTNQPTCTASGVKTFTCGSCGETKTETIASEGHKYSGGKCTVCGDCQHSWDDGVVTTQPTCSASGVKTFTCGNCGETKTETVAALGHNMVNGTCTRCGESDSCNHFWRGGSTVSATCEKEGSYTETCLICKAKRTEIIPAKGHKYSAGRCYVCGKEADSIEYVDIATAAELVAFANRVNAGENTLNARLTADIDLKGANWTPIGLYNGEYSASVCYKGRFNGNGHTISNFNVVGDEYVGLIGYAEIAVIQNLGVINVTATGWNAGAIAGFASTSTIENCFAKDCKITGYTTNALALTSRSVHIGAVAGANGGTVKNCYAINCTLVDKTSDMTVPSGETYTPWHECKSSPIGGADTQNGYYCNVTISGEFTSTRNSTEVTEAQLRSGEVTFKLNKGVTDGTQGWYQTIGTDPLPTFSGKTVYETANGTYVNEAVGCDHNWNAATCTAPKTCSKCGETEGTALGHKWTDATCTAPKTCSVCGTKEGTAAGHKYVNGTCSVCGGKDPNYVVPVVKPTITLSYPTLSFESEVFYNVYFTATNTEDVEEMGLITWYTRPEDSESATFDTAEAVIPNAVYNAGSDIYMARSEGVPAKQLGDSMYFRVYAKLTDGTYVYGQLTYYSAKFYAASIFGNSTNENMKSLCVAMLNYGAAAQVHFNYKTDDLMNSVLSASQKALVKEYSADMIGSVVAADPSKVGTFNSNGGFSNGYPSVSFEGAFSINYYLIPKYAVDGNMTLYCWDLATYNSVSTLTEANATDTVVMTKGSNLYVGAYEGIAAKQIDETVFVAGVYTSGGVRYSSPVISYSLGEYCKDQIANGSETMKAFAAETAVYGHYAKAYFASLEG